MSGARTCHFVVVSSFYWFSWSSSCLFLVFPFMCLVLGIGWKRGKLMELREILLENYILQRNGMHKIL